MQRAIATASDRRTVSHLKRFWQMVFTDKNRDQACINTIRTLAMDAVQAANSGHPGTPMAMVTKALLQ